MLEIYTYFALALTIFLSTIIAEITKHFLHKKLLKKFK